MSRIEQELAAREDLAAKLRDLSQYYSQQPPKIRKREFVYAGALLAILAWHIFAAPQGQVDTGDDRLTARVRDGRATGETRQAGRNPAVAAPHCEKYRDVIIAAANQGQFLIGDDVISCRRDKVRK